MKPRLSIFSFSTIRLPFRLTRTLLLCVTLVVAAEAAARIMVYTGMVKETPSAKKMIRDNVSTLRSRKPATWLIGNSTLEFGINHVQIEKHSQSGSIKLCHGSATVSGSSAMLSFYLQSVSYTPKNVILFITKDDINQNGLGAHISTLYHEYASWRKHFKIYSYLRAVRFNLYRKYKHMWARLMIDKQNRSQWLQEHPVINYNIDSKKITKDMMKNYEIDSSSISYFSKICKDNGIENILLVLLPISEEYIAWHNKTYPSLKYQHISLYISRQCKKAHIHFIDLGSPPANDDFFNDYFHLNEKGAEKITKKLLKMILRGYKP